MVFHKLPTQTLRVLIYFRSGLHKPTHHHTIVSEKKIIIMFRRFPLTFYSESVFDSSVGFFPVSVLTAKTPSASDAKSAYITHTRYSTGTLNSSNTTFGPKFTERTDWAITMMTSRFCGRRPIYALRELWVPALCLTSIGPLHSLQ